jgi:hypothetical protein
MSVKLHTYPTWQWSHEIPKSEEQGITVGINVMISNGMCAESTATQQARTLTSQWCRLLRNAKLWRLGRQTVAKCKVHFGCLLRCLLRRTWEYVVTTGDVCPGLSNLVWMVDAPRQRGSAASCHAALATGNLPPWSVAFLERHRFNCQQIHWKFRQIHTHTYYIHVYIYIYIYV